MAIQTERKAIADGTQRTIRGKPCVYYDGYWIRRYDYSKGTLADRKQIIDLLTRRVFRHVEQGMNTPGNRLHMIEESYHQETDPARKRVKGAMLAGSLLNRGRDILTRIVGLEECGVKICSDNELLLECNKCFARALELGKNIKLRSGEEGLDELWGEPFRAFTLPPKEFYRGRYIKLAQTMAKIDELADVMMHIIRSIRSLSGARALLCELRDSAKETVETLRSDPLIFEVWPRFVVAREELDNYQPQFSEKERGKRSRVALELIREGSLLVGQLAVVRVSMPVSIANYMERCDVFFMMK